MSTVLLLGGTGGSGKNIQEFQLLNQYANALNMNKIMSPLKY
eukprot:gene9510-1717_t